MIKLEEKLVVDSNLEHALLVGNLFPNLVSKYKFEPKKPNFKSEKERLLYYVQIYNFYTLELTLYIATHPNNKEAIRLLTEANDERKKILAYVNEKFSLCRNTNPVESYFANCLPWSDK